MILYVLIALIIIILIIRYYSKFEYFSNCKKQQLHNNIKNVKSMNNMISGLSHKKATFRTCYPTGSADVGNCFDDLPQYQNQMEYI